MKKLFITATDTDAGKTYCAEIITKSFVASGLKVAVYKPISAGCELIDNCMINEDAQRLLAQSNCYQQLTEVNPIAFQAAIAPHIAAQQLQQEIDLDLIKQGYDNISKINPDIIICEGAGGWRLPLGKGKFLSEFVQQSSQDVILVVNMKLGCLNHALLTYQAIIADGLHCVGWIANNQENMPYLQENIDELTAYFPMPKLAEFSFQPNIDQAIKHIDLSTLI